MAGTTDGDEAEVQGVDGLETSELVALVHPGLPEGEGGVLHEARGPVLSSSEGDGGISVSRVDEDANTVVQEVGVDGHHGGPVANPVLVDLVIADGPAEILLNMDGSLDIGAVQPDFSVARVDARNLSKGLEKLVGSLSVAILNGLHDGALI